jgi:hypothetical protein
MPRLKKEVSNDAILKHDIRIEATFEKRGQ